MHLIKFDLRFLKSVYLLRFVLIVICEFHNKLQNQYPMPLTKHKGVTFETLSFHGIWGGNASLPNMLRSAYFSEFLIYVDYFYNNLGFNFCGEECVGLGHVVMLTVGILYI